MPPERSEKPDSLEARLRRLPPPSVPADLEARLLAAIPTSESSNHRLGLSAKPQAMSGRRWRWAWWMGAASALAAACLLIVLAWPKGEGQKAVLDSKDRVTTTSPTPSTLPHSPQGTLQAQGDPDDLKLPPFTWPVQEATHVTLSSSIPSDLLN